MLNHTLCRRQPANQLLGACLVWMSAFLGMVAYFLTVFPEGLSSFSRGEVKEIRNSLVPRLGPLFHFMYGSAGSWIGATATTPAWVAVIYITLIELTILLFPVLKPGKPDVPRPTLLRIVKTSVSVYVGVLLGMWLREMTL